MTKAELIAAMKDMPDDMPILVQHHCSAVLFYELDHLKIRKIKGKDWLIIEPNEYSEMMLSRENEESGHE